ncbi:hypothetical protein PHLCEN_2v4054 [Hermanssonia centrifuga]|uniref:Uncharacterized protein n=1 Tax=Hermanssonia centrifuga TaxID=98765 RepID=A0A2R6Q5G7_9APHY|nr:hypothetical protein PHLCEN_2v4054 [Hermanssonia centrifuga]
MAAATNGQQTGKHAAGPPPSNIQSDIAVLRALLKDGEPGDSLDEPDIEELLRRLESADGIARGVEDRLDDVIGNLDGLLESLESGLGEEKAVVVDPKTSEDGSGKETSLGSDGKRNGAQ